MQSARAAIVSKIIDRSGVAAAIADVRWCMVALERDSLDGLLTRVFV